MIEIVSMHMHQQTWLAAAASFLGMWLVMTVAMMLPSLVPMLSRYRRAIADVGGVRLAALIALVSVGYFSVWMLFGIAVFPVSHALAAIEMKLPVAASVVVLIAGVWQFSKWKARRLFDCRESPANGCSLSASADAALRHGVRLGVHCGQSCAGVMVVLLAYNVMDVRAMAIATAAITLERVAENGVRVARAIGVVLVVAGLALIVRAAGATA
ncbi:MAG TPA: DUF2182 domain-containing protein [Gemmatimonadaceae bacterium]